MWRRGGQAAGTWTSEVSREGRWGKDGGGPAMGGGMEAAGTW